ncbi:MAG: tRNA pseudouridine(55) synthase TruB [Clostridia bacterium]|nr:tRNA pseudouridine(55) synthase TruB [Clostridia bacterium]
MKNGVIIVNKENGPTSQGVVNRIKRIFGASKAGHTGTLDPMATGVLPVLVERGVKASEFMLTSDKHYVATLLLGVTTDTEDVTGQTLTTCDSIPTEAEVISAVNSFVGEYMQTPPMFSALKVGGKKLCDLARDGVTIDRQPRQVTIHSIGVEKINDREYSLDVHCSKGTYIRTLCADIGARLGCGGTMKTLCRASASGFTLADAHTLSELENMTDEERESCIFPVEYIFRACPEVKLPEFYARLAHHGLEIYLKKIGAHFELGQLVRLCDANGFFALGEVRQFDDGPAIKPIRQF